MKFETETPSGDIMGGQMPALKTKSRKTTTRGKATREDEGQYFSRAVAKGLELLQILETAQKPLPLNQLAAAVRLTKPSAFRLLFTLEAKGYALKGDDGRYTINHDLRRSVRDRLIGDLLEAAVPRMRELTREFRETTGLAVLFESHIEVVAVVDSPQTIRMGNTVGRILQPHASSLGKCITAFQAEERREHLLRCYGVSSFTERTITDERELAGEFERIREQGFAMDRGETCLDGQCVGAPIRNGHGEVFAALSMSVPIIRVGSLEHQQKMREQVIAAAAAIGDALAV